MHRHSNLYVASELFVVACCCCFGQSGRGKLSSISSVIGSSRDSFAVKKHPRSSLRGCTVFATVAAVNIARDSISPGRLLSGRWRVLLWRLYGAKIATHDLAEVGRWESCVCVGAWTL